MDSSTNTREATISKGIYLVQLGTRESGIAQRDQFAKLHLTGPGRRIYETADERMSDDEIRSIVTRAVDAGY